MTNTERDAAAEGHAESPECPFCGSTDTELESAWGSEVSKSQYYCNGCHTVFERIKFDGELPDTGR
ncbi:MAG: hypothetical protein ABEI39_03455 [Halobacteriales archaeon]